jgi:hypothetical protein
MNQILLSLCFTAISLIRLSSSATPQQLIEGVDQYHTINAKKNESRTFKFFSFTLEKFQKDSNLVVTLQTDDPRSDPDVFIFKGSKADPTDINTALVICELVGGEICVVQEKDLKAKTAYPITVACNSNCSFSIRVDYVKTQYIPLELNTEGHINNIFSLDKNKSPVRIVRLSIPKADLIERLTIETRLKVDSLTQDDRVTAVQCYLNKGNLVPSSSVYDKKGKALWTDVGEIISLNKYSQIFTDKGLFCVSCNYTVIIIGQVGYNLEMEINSGTKIKALQTSDFLKDIVEAKDSNNYQIYLDDKDGSNKTELWIEVIVFSGKLTLYVNSNKIPDSLSSSEHMLEIDESETFIISNEELRKNKLMNKTVFITIEGKDQPSTYYLTVTFSELTNLIFLSSSEWKSGYVLSKELVLHYLVIGAYLDDITIKIDLVRKSVGPELYIKKCCSLPSFAECTFTEEDVLKYPANKDTLIRYGNKEGKLVFI